MVYLKGTGDVPQCFDKADPSQPMIPPVVAEVRPHLTMKVAFIRW